MGTRRLNSLAVIWSVKSAIADMGVRALPAMRYPANPAAIPMGGYQQLIRGEPFRGKFRKSFEKPVPFEPGKPDRITFTLPALLDTQGLFLHIEGEPKRQLLADARLGLGAGKDYPVRSVLTQTRVPVAVYWCP